MKSNLPIKIDLPRGFLEAEVRCGYEVSAKMKRIWAIELDLLQQFKEVCEKHGIKFQIFAGTLLGAVRHKGFIPWDDDIDVCMDRENYDKLLNLPKDTFNEPYFLQTAFSEKLFFLPHARLRNSMTTAIITNMSDKNYNNGIYIDIFVLDGYVQSKQFRRVQFTLKYFLERLLWDYWRKGIRHKRLSTIVSYLLKPLCHLIGYGNLIRLHTFIVCLPGKKSRFISILSYGEKMSRRYVLRRDELADSENLLFEWIKVPAARDYDSVLRRIYGNYMEYPPIESRGEWHANAITFDPDVPYKNFILNNYGDDVQ